MRVLIYSIICIGFINVFSCGKKPDHPYNRISTINFEVKNLFAPAKEGSYYIYEDSVSGRQDSVYVSNYFDAVICQTCSNGNPHSINVSYKSTLDDYKYSWNMTLKTDCLDSLNSIDFRRRIGSNGTLFYTKQKGFYFRNYQLYKYDSMTIHGTKYSNVYYLSNGVFFWTPDVGIIKYYTNRLGTINGITYYEEVWKLKRKKIIN